MHTLELPSKLQNKFYLMRHGHSRPNEQEIILSDPALGILAENGLTDLGRAQAAEAAGLTTLDKHCIIYSSDFSRAAETARIMQESLGAAAVKHTPQLRERFFGELDGQHKSAYARIWEHDSQVPENVRVLGVETINSVAARMLRIVTMLDIAHKDRTFLLVSHGDPLAILQTALSGDPLGTHNAYHLRNAQLIQMPFSPRRS